MSQKKELKIISSTNVEVKDINWLWYPFIPRGKVTILQGDPGEGKSTFMLTLAAYLTRGEALPFTDCGEPPDPITVLYQSTEDDYDDTIVPRFIKAGGIRDGREVPKLPEDKRKLLKRLRKYLRYADNLFSETKS
ncbi:MAG: hypothetical protein E7386_00470 [Ruminococcaceae bacterium]|nr:hypothetical protein [Oscillospiraceae bacterium]